MNKRQDSKSNMLLVVRDFLLKNVSITSTLPNFTMFFTALQNSIALIQKFSEQQTLDRSGLHDKKKELRSILIMMAADVSRKIQAYAQFINNLILGGKTKYSETQLKKSTDNKLRDQAKGLYDHVQSNLSALEPYELTEASQVTFLAAINNFDAAIPMPRLGTTDRMQNTLGLKNAFIEADKNLDNIDTLVEIVRLKEPSFYLGYKSARKPKNKGYSLAVKGQVIDADSGLPVKGVTVMFFIDDNRTNPVVVKKTARKGGFILKALHPGMYIVVIKKYGYAEQVATIAISHGEMTKFKVELKKM